MEEHIIIYQATEEARVHECAPLFFSVQGCHPILVIEFYG